MLNNNIGRLVLSALIFLTAMPLCADTASPDRGVHERWIVVLDDGVSVDTLLSQHGVQPDAIAHYYRHTLNGFAIDITAGRAKRLAQAPGVRSVTRDRPMPAPEIGPSRSFITGNGAADTDPVAALTGATLVWQGAAPGLAPTQGEGIVVGIVGGRLNDEHPSFAATGGDGYVHNNPLGPGIYLGVCATEPGRCNDKLIGRWEFAYSSANEFGTTAAAAQAAGNILFDRQLAGAGSVTVTLAGIAPHANLIEYAVCGSSCNSSDFLAGLDQARADGVDVLIVTVGSAGGTPWTDPAALAMRALRDAGISVAVSLLVSSATVARNAPWTASVQRSTHAVTPVLELDDFDGGLQPPQAPIEARGSVADLTAGVVFAGNVGDPLCAPGSFAPGTLTGSIVLCLRGSYPIVDKIEAVTAGGGLAAIIPVSNFIFQSFNYPRAALVTEADGDLLFDWLAQGSGHALSIAGMLAHDLDNADRIPAFVARGPNASLEFLVPTLTAPSLDVFVPAANGTEVIVADGLASAPVAGAMALLKRLHPDWTDAELLSALMTTTVTTLEDDGTGGPADTWLRGAGRIDVAAAARAGLVMHESTDAFIAADPGQGGDPAALNLPALVQLDCTGVCNWAREVRATSAGNWTAQAVVDGAAMTVSPATFSLQPHERLTLSIQADTATIPPNEYRFGEVRLTPVAGDTAPPDTVLPVVVAAFADTDGDRIFDVHDNCREIVNPDQRDTDVDGFGNRCDPDLNNDGAVNFVDLERLRAAFDRYTTHADFNGDGVIDTGDLAIMEAFFFGTPGPGAAD